MDMFSRRVFEHIDSLTILSTGRAGPTHEKQNMYFYFVP